MRNIVKVADDIIKIINEKSDFEKYKKQYIISIIEQIKINSCYRAPEVAYLDWDNLASVLGFYFTPSNSKWETEIMIIFNGLEGTVEDYYQPI